MPDRELDCPCRPPAPPPLISRYRQAAPTQRRSDREIERGHPSRHRNPTRQNGVTDGPVMQEEVYLGMCNFVFPRIIIFPIARRFLLPYVMFVLVDIEIHYERSDKGGAKFFLE